MKLYDFAFGLHGVQGVASSSLATPTVKIRGLQRIVDLFYFLFAYNLHTTFAIRFCLPFALMQTSHYSYTYCYPRPLFWLFNRHLRHLSMLRCDAFVNKLIFCHFVSPKSAFSLLMHTQLPIVFL